VTPGAPQQENSKFFKEDAIPFAALKQVEGVAHVMPVIEENGLLHYRDAQYVCTIKGVGEEFKKMSGLDSMIINGSFDLHMGKTSSALVGSGVAYALSLKQLAGTPLFAHTGILSDPLNIYYLTMGLILIGLAPNFIGRKPLKT
jgi:ABC-type lipoprotein release transport system permease subunit